jgi:hypothetical protein
MSGDLLLWGAPRPAVATGVALGEASVCCQVDSGKSARTAVTAARVATPTPNSMLKTKFLMSCQLSLSGCLAVRRFLISIYLLAVDSRQLTA